MRVWEKEGGWVGGVYWRKCPSFSTSSTVPIFCQYSATLCWLHLIMREVWRTWVFGVLVRDATMVLSLLLSI